MKGWPSGVQQHAPALAPPPPLIRKPSAPGTDRAVGWNWMYSALMMRAPARLAMANPSRRPRPGGWWWLR